MAVLALDHDPGIFLAFGAIEGEDDHAAVVANDIALAVLAAGLDQLVVPHAKERALVDDCGAETCSATSTSGLALSSWRPFFVFRALAFLPAGFVFL